MKLAALNIYNCTYIVDKLLIMNYHTLCSIETNCFTPILFHSIFWTQFGEIVFLIINAPPIKPLLISRFCGLKADNSLWLPLNGTRIHCRLLLQADRLAENTNLGFWEPCVLYAMKIFDFVSPVCVILWAFILSVSIYFICELFIIDYVTCCMHTAHVIVEQFMIFS